MTIQQDAAGFEYGRVLEFIEVHLDDAITGDGDEYFRVYNSWNNSDADGEISFLGVTWSPLPFQSEGWGADGSGGTPRPLITLADFDGTFLMASLQYHDMIGAKVRRWETTTANRAAGSYYGPEIWFVNQIVETDGMTIKLGLASPTDLKSRKVPGIRMTRARFPALGRNRLA